ncbi:si:ch211-225h24.2 [Megalops cyprinoides]|uniref:si:ch211-225h24.2 n=1 Tax=Megalops cyprinoides TaxID=118141 RepID=UPI001863AB36|nr:si:ch211-225h24.2 [Megalops cyprinoides]
MFKKSKGKVLVEYASEEDDVSWHHQHTYKDKGPDGEEEIASSASKDFKVKKIKSKKEKRDKKLFFAPDDEHFLLTGVAAAEGKGSSKKTKEEDKSNIFIEKGQCFWDSVTMTMKQITPTKKMDKIEGWEPPRISEATEEAEDCMARDSLVQPDECPSWTGLEEDSSKYTNLSKSHEPGIRWTTKAKGKLAGIRRRSRGSVSESWEGLK